MNNNLHELLKNNPPVKMCITNKGILCVTSTKGRYNINWNFVIDLAELAYRFKFRT